MRLSQLQPEPHVESFYHLKDVDVTHAHCSGMACFAARHLQPDRWRQAMEQSPRVYCLGKCYAAPASGEDQQQPTIEVHSKKAVVLERIAQGGARTLDEYKRQGGMIALQRALAANAQNVIAQIEMSRLRGRGGAGFPTGAKWRAVAGQKSAEKFVVANLDEGDSGAYIDRFIAEDDPFCLLEGMAIAAHAVGAKQAFIYVRCEYPGAIRSLQDAINAAHRDASLGIDVQLAIGRGSYVCGEETALLNSIEGVRPVARVRPPYVAERGLYGAPTLVNNVETLASVPWIIRNGAEEYAALGFSNSRGTKVISLNSLFRRPGLYEIEFGIPLRKIVERIGGGLRSGTLRGVMIGGPLAGVVPPSLLDTRFGFEELHAIGASVGHGGIIAFDEHTSIADLVRHVFQFGAEESCGKCTPCRLGSRRIEEIFSSGGEEDEWLDIVNALKQTSLCGFGTGLAEFAQSIIRYYPSELRSCFK
jgi:NADH:ubiquinone oxidoreductase subunit F (NADH-binding)